MPVRSLNSSVMKWPDRETVHQAIEVWAKRLQDAQPNVQQVGYFGSYARGDWGVGSDVDVVLVVEGASENGEVRGTDVDATASRFLPTSWSTLLTSGTRCRDGCARCSSERWFG